MSRTEARVPAFWRVVRDIEGRKQWRHIDGVNWCMEIGAARTFVRECDAKRFADSRSHVVPVYVTVRQVKRGHDFGWALKRMREGKRVRRRGWDTGASLHISEFDVAHQFNGFQLAQLDWELAE